MIADAEPTTVPHVDLQRYLGLWFELARLPMKYEDEAASDISARYSLKPNGRIKVDNRAFDAEDKPVQAIGEATAVDDSNARLKVSFLPAGLRWLPFTTGDYWILKLDAGYRTALVGSPDRKFLWLLSRTPELGSAERAAFLDEARRQGFDLARLIVPRHTGRDVPVADTGG